MTITDTFVLLNYPKSGSTFARTVLKELYLNRGKSYSFFQKLCFHLRLRHKPLHKDFPVPNLRPSSVVLPTHLHGWYSQIPSKYRDREVVSVVRNPYDRFLSNYEFRWWAKYPSVNKEILNKHLPHFPDLTIDDFVDYMELQLRYLILNGEKPKANIGNQTAQFIQMFFKRPQHVLANLSETYIASDEVFEDIGNITFLRTESLNSDLASFLERHGFSSEELQYVLRRDRVNVTLQQSGNRNELWTKKSLDYIRVRERLIFTILKKHGIEYMSPFDDCVE